MEYVQKYWYVILGGLVLLYFLSKGNSGGITQVGGSADSGLAYAQLNQAAVNAQADRAYSFANQFLNYDLSLRSLASNDALARIGLSQQIDLARISANAQAQALQSQTSLAQLAYNLQNQQYNAALSLQQQAIQAAYNTKRRNDYLGAITSGIQAILPNLFGNSVSGGGGLFGGSGGGFIFH